MVTKSPIQMVEASAKSGSTSTGIEDLGLVSMGRRFQGEKSNSSPNRSESAPPSMEGSFAATENLMVRQNFTPTEEHIRSNPSYVEYYMSHVNLNPRLPPPLISFDDTFRSSLQLDHGNLSTHKEDPDDDRSPKEEDLPQPPCEESGNHEDANPATTTVSSSSSIDGRRVDMVIVPPKNTSSNLPSQDSVSTITNGISSLNVSSNETGWQQRNPLPVHHGPHLRMIYPSMIPPGYFPPPYTFGPVSPYATGYLPNNPFPTPFGNTGQSFNAQNHTPAVNLPHPNNLYGYFGLPFSVQEQGFQSLGGVDHVDLNSRRVGPTNPYYFGSPTCMDFLQVPSSPFASPLMMGSPTRVYSDWKGHNGNFVVNDSKARLFLEDLKSRKGRRLELSDIYGHIVEFSVDKFGSRFIQQKLEVCSNEEKESLFKKVIPHALKLMTDMFGNYVIQKFLEYGNAEQRRELGSQLDGQILPLTLQTYGCRVMQKAVEVFEVEQKKKIISELDGYLLQCARDQNGSHVIQKCIECNPPENIKNVISSFRGQVAALSKHPYGCRVIQSVLQHSTHELDSQFIVDEILDDVYDLAQDQFGNYVTQSVLEGGKPEEKSQIVHKLAGHIVELSQHKFASNVIEKCMAYGDETAREIMIQEMTGYADGNDNLLVMIKDQYANYVVQKVLKTCSDHQREALLDRIKIHLNSLKTYTYGKHIVARFEQLHGEELEPLGS